MKFLRIVAWSYSWRGRGKKIHPSRELTSNNKNAFVNDAWVIVCASCGVRVYRVTIPLVQNLPLTSKQKARPGQARPKQSFCFEVNGRF